MQKKEEIKPIFLNLDDSFSELKPYQTPFLKGLSFDIGKNPVSNIGTNNPTGVGQNNLKQHTIQSNSEVPNVFLPEGYNKHIGSFESITTQELYHFNYNINGNHGIYVLGGNTGLWRTVIIDSELGFTDSQENYIANHRVLLRFVKDKSNNIIEIYLLITEGNTWQKYINVIASIKTNGFDNSLFPYWNLRQPHFDRRELLEWPVRPPMIKPEVSIISNSETDSGKINKFVDKGIQVAYVFQNTDGRESVFSPFSLPIIIKSEDYLSNPDSIPKNVLTKLYAGSALTEKILFYVRSAKKGTNTLPSIQEWGDWFLYDTLKRFPNSNTGNILGTDYWLREDQWAAYNYDNVFNTIEYQFDLSKVLQITDQNDANLVQTGMPQLSVAITDLGDAALLGDNRYGYPNFGSDVISNITASINEKVVASCKILSRTIRLYAYVGSPFDTNQWASQVGYYTGDDKSIVFGGLSVGRDNRVSFDDKVSSTFELNFADKNAFRCYLKGTPYYADGVWYQVTSGNTLVKVPQALDIRLDSTKEYIQNVYATQGYFVCVFDITAPAGKYTATLGRHNIESTGDYRSKSTYIYGIANSRQKSVTTVLGMPITSIKPSAINNGNGILYSKEMEVDCTNDNVDVWGNNSDLFYVYCPYITNNHEWRFFEGYWKEDIPAINGSAIPIEMFPYKMSKGGNDWGQFTDKNGFYWGYINSFNPRSNTVDIQMVAKVNCAYPTTYSITTIQPGTGWRVNADNYLAQYNGNVVGNANRIIYTGKVTSLDGLLNYSNIAISIKDGSTVYTRSDGTFTLYVHNGMPVLRQSNVYVNAGGNFFITIANCGQVPLFNFSENLAPCISPTALRQYPVPLNLAVSINTDRQLSVKEGGRYSIGAAGADLAGRLMYVNDISDLSVPTFLQRNNLNATYFQVGLNAALDLSDYSDMKWMIFYVSKNKSIKRYIQWVGDSINYIDNNGGKVADPSSAVFVSIKINSLFNSNVAKNFSLLSTYQFVKGDRVRIIDDGNGNIYDTANFGEPIDLQILGTNYQQAAVDSGLLPPDSNTVLSTQTVSADVELILRYDSRLDKLIDKTGFWIEIYTPTEQSDIVPFYEDKIFPIVNGRPAIFTGFANGQPTYTYPSLIDIDFWDTYLFDRSITIPNVGSKYFSHPFESPNVTDNWGADLISGGRNNIKNENARQYWLGGETAKSDDFLREGILNGLAMFRESNKKNFGTYPFGAIVAMKSSRNILICVCENDWFTTDYNFHRAFLNEQGVLVANLDDGLSAAYQKIGDVFGMAKEDTGTFIFFDKEVYWYDRKNTAYLRCSFREATDVTAKSQSEQGGMQAYFNAKSDFITEWNNAHTKENSFDIVSGVDVELGKIYITFRSRRNNSNEITSYINNRRNWQTNFQETVVYDTINRGWIRCEGFAPEGYGSLRGNETGTELISFAAGKPYLHKSGKNGFGEFYGVQTTPVFIGVLNEGTGIVKDYEALYYSANPASWYIDYMFSDFKNSLSWISINQFRNYFNNYYAAILRNANSYPNNAPEDLFRSMLLDGYKTVGQYLVFRMVGGYDTLNDYKEIGSVTGLIKMDETNKK